MNNNEVDMYIDQALTLLSAAGFRNNYVEKESRGFLKGEICYVNFHPDREITFIELTSYTFNLFVTLDELKKILASEKTATCQ